MDPQRLFEEFATEYRREGSADPRPYLARAQEGDRAELQLLIEAFLERVPRQPWDPDAFAGSAAARALERVRASAPDTADAGQASGWTELLPSLRTRARLTRRAVVERLAAGIGFVGEEERVAAYYHRMERGDLKPSGVSARVLEVLAGILGSSATALRRAGELGQSAAEAGGEVFARVGAPSGQVSLGADPARAGDRDAVPPDELDLLFTGGESDVR